MIDYLYQMDYDDLSPRKRLAKVTEDASSPPPDTLDHGTLDLNEIPAEASVSGPAPEPDLFEHPEKTAIDYDEWVFGAKSKKSKKDKKKVKRPQSLRMKDYGQDLDTERLTINTLMYALADKYAIDDLKVLAKTKFEEAVVQDWDSQAFAHAAELVFTTTPSSDQGLRKIVIKTMNQHRDLVNYEEIQNLLNSGNGMAWALVQVLFGDQSDQEWL